LKFERIACSNDQYEIAVFSGEPEEVPQKPECADRFVWLLQSIRDSRLDEVLDFPSVPHWAPSERFAGDQIAFRVPRGTYLAPAVDPRDARIAELETANTKLSESIIECMRARDVAEADKRIAQNNRDERDQAATDYRRERDAQKARADNLEAEIEKYKRDTLRLRDVAASKDALCRALEDRIVVAEKYRTDVQATLSCAASVIEMLLSWHTHSITESEVDDATYRGALGGVRCVQRAIAEACK
jgi:hypothetical protein